MQNDPSEPKSISDIAVFRKALIHLDHGLVAEAIADLEDLSRKTPASSRLWHTLGTAYGRAGRDDESYKAYKQSLMNEDCPSKPLHELAQAFLKVGDRENAMLALKRLSQIRPDLAAEFEMSLRSFSQEP
jgi:Flp pilus assembly protein TadD